MISADPLPSQHHPPSPHVPSSPHPPRPDHIRNFSDDKVDFRWGERFLQHKGGANRHRNRFVKTHKVPN